MRKAGKEVKNLREATLLSEVFRTEAHQNTTAPCFICLSLDRQSIQPSSEALRTRHGALTHQNCYPC